MDINNLEKLRIKVLNSIKSYTVLVISLFLSFFLLLFLKYFNIISIKYIIIVLVVLIFLILIMINKSKRLQIQYDKLYNENLVLPQLKNAFDHVDYMCENSTDNKIDFLNTLFDIENKTRITNFLLATYKNIKFECFNLFFSKEHNYSGMNESSFHTYEIFNGYWLVFEFKSNISEDSIFLKHKGDEYYDIISDNFINRDSIISNFDIYSFNSVDIKTIISPEILDMINNYFKNYAQGLYIYIEKNKLNIGITNQKGLFESSCYEKIDIDKINADIQIILSIIDNLIIKIVDHIG